MVYVSLRQIPQQNRQLSRAAFPVVSQKCKLLWSRGFWVAATGNRWLAHLALAPECFSQEVAQMTSPPMSLDTITHMAYPTSRGWEAWGSSWLWSEPWDVFLILGIWKHLNLWTDMVRRENKYLLHAETFVHASSHSFFTTPPTISLIFHIRTLSLRDLSMSAEIYSTSNLLNKSFSPSVWYQSPSPLYSSTVCNCSYQSLLVCVMSGFPHLWSSVPLMFFNEIPC